MPYQAPTAGSIIGNQEVSVQLAPTPSLAKLRNPDIYRLSSWVVHGHTGDRSAGLRQEAGAGGVDERADRPASFSLQIQERRRRPRLLRRPSSTAATANGAEAPLRRQRQPRSRQSSSEPRRRGLCASWRSSDQQASMLVPLLHHWETEQAQDILLPVFSVLCDPRRRGDAYRCLHRVRLSPIMPPLSISRR